MRLNLDIDEPTLAKVGAPFNVNIVCTRPQSVDMFPQTATQKTREPSLKPPQAKDNPRSQRQICTHLICPRNQYDNLNVRFLGYFQLT